MTGVNAHNGSKPLHLADYPTVPQVATDLGVSDETVRRWIRQRRLKAVRVGPRTLRIDPESLTELVQAR